VANRALPANVSPLQLYLQEVARHPLLEPEEEYDLAVRHFEDGDVHAAHRLITSNLRLVVKIANDFRRAQESTLDLIQEGNYGLMQAVKRYNPYKGVKLSSYAAWWIRAYILKYLMDNKSLVKMGTTTAQRKLFFNLRKEAEKLLAEYDRVDTKLLASNLNVREKDVVEMQQRLAGPDLSFDEPVSEGSDVTRGSTYADPGESVEDILAKKEVQTIFKKHLDEFKKRITGRDLELFEDRLLSVQPMTLQEFGERHGISRERARQIEVRLMQKLKEFVREKGFV
jgi:RNA polymerase sigma-32 factor